MAVKIHFTSNIFCDQITWHRLIKILHKKSELKSFLNLFSELFHHFQKQNDIVFLYNIWCETPCIYKFGYFCSIIMKLAEFLVPCTQLYNPLCRSVGPLVRPSVTLCFFLSFYIILGYFMSFKVNLSHFKLFLSHFQSF